MLGPSVDVAAVASGGGERGEVGADSSPLAPWVATSSRSAVDVGGHAAGVAADVDVGAFLEPGEDLGAALGDPVLDVDLAAVVPAERGVEAVEDAAALQVAEFLLVEVIVGGPLVAEEEPVPAPGPEGVALVEEGEERGDARAGADHDEGGVGILGQAESVRGVDEDAKGEPGPTRSASIVEATPLRRRPLDSYATRRTVR